MRLNEGGRAGGQEGHIMKFLQMASLSTAVITHHDSLPAWLLRSDLGSDSVIR